MEYNRNKGDMSYRLYLISSEADGFSMLAHAEIEKLDAIPGLVITEIVHYRSKAAVGTLFKGDITTIDVRNTRLKRFKTFPQVFLYKGGEEILHLKGYQPDMTSRIRKAMR